MNVGKQQCEVKMVNERAVYKKDCENRTKNFGESAGITREILTVD